MPENNECQPIVIFPLGVACQVTNPSGPSLSNGSATLIVTGGTPPYNITWENGNSSFAIDNLSAGSYPATIVDYYGDFTANTTCVLVSPTTTTTTLPSTPMCFGVISEGSAGIQCTTPALGYYNGKPYYEIYLINCGTPSGIYVWWDSEDIRWVFSDELGGGEIYQYNENPSNFPESNGEYPWTNVSPKIEIQYSTFGECELLYDFCMVINYPNSEEEVNLSIHFNPNGIVNGKQSWISDDELYTVIWDNVDNRWELVDTLNNLTVINNDPTYPPLNGWLILGKKGTVSVTEGECQNNDNLSLKVSTNEPQCEGCDASISIEGSGGIPPYQYTINGGQTWVGSPIFQGLCASVTYTPQIKDSTDTIVVSQSGNVSFTPKVTTGYTISMNRVSTVQVSNTSYEYTYVVSITPPLPNNGTTIKFDINFSGMFTQTPYLNSATKSYVTEIIKNGLTIPSVDDDVVTTATNTTQGCTNYLIYNTTFNREYTNLTINSTDVYSITLITNYQLTCGNPPPPTPVLFEIQTPEPTPLPNDYDTVDLGDGPLGPLKYGASATGLGNSCCRANFSVNDSYSLTNPTITGCQCCSVTGFQYFYNRS